MTTTLNGLLIDDHTITVPLVPDVPDDHRTIDVFARVVTRAGGETLPFLVFLQGGPGVEAPRAFPSWLPVALERHRVVMLDQRGTGRSTPLTDDALALSPDALAEYCTHLRADGIVADCEAMRGHLGARTWSVLGQSFGGFTLLHYLSRHPESVDRAYFTGGLPPVGRHPDDVYAITWTSMAARTREFYRLFPDDRDAVRRCLDLAAAGELTLPNGDAVSPGRFRSVGHVLGTNDGAATLHWLLDLDPKGNAFRHDLAALLPFSARNPLYAVVHESSYADGGATRWSAARTRPDEFDADETLLSGEHLLPEWFDESSELRPWGPAARIIAEHDWPRLYDPDALANSGAVGAAAVYYRDVYVPLGFSMQTADLLPGVTTFITSEHEHNGLRASNGIVLRHLFELVAGERLR